MEAYPLTSQFDKRTHRRTTTKQRQPSIAGADFLLPSRNASDEWRQQQQAYLFAIPTAEKMEEDERRRSGSTPARPDHHNNFSCTPQILALSQSLSLSL